MRRSRVLVALLVVVLPVAARSAGAHERITTEVTFTREVVRIFQARCLPCHSPGGSSMPLMSYSAARPWAKAIRDEVLARRMPPWPPRAGVGELANDGSLTPHMVDLLVAWAEGGAPEGDPADLPQGPPAPSASLEPLPGKPILRIAREARLASGGVLYALRPMGPRGASIEVRAIGAKGSQRSLIWIPSFAPAYPYTYALRQPLELEPGVRIRVFGPATARVDLTLTPPSPPAPTEGSP